MKSDAHDEDLPVHQPKLEGMRFSPKLLGNPGIISTLFESFSNWSLEHEIQKWLKSTITLSDHAFSAKDFATSVFMQWYVNEQNAKKKHVS